MADIVTGGRHYTVATDYVLFEDGVADSVKTEALKLLYGEVCAQWRNLHDTRFKLLALVPIAAIATVLLTDSNVATAGNPTYIAVFALGLTATVGVAIYDHRNSQLYNDLISRGRKIEAELGVMTGVFRGRLRARSRLVNHSVALFLIYGASKAAWIVGILRAAGVFAP